MFENLKFSKCENLKFSKFFLWGKSLVGNVVNPNVLYLFSDILSLKGPKKFSRRVRKFLFVLEKFYGLRRIFQSVFTSKRSVLSTEKFKKTISFAKAYVVNQRDSKKKEENVVHRTPVV